MSEENSKGSGENKRHVLAYLLKSSFIHMQEHFDTKNMGYCVCMCACVCERKCMCVCEREFHNFVCKCT